MNASSGSYARIAGIALVLILAATLGLIVGNVLNARNDRAGSGAGGAAMPHLGGLDGAHYAALQQVDAGNPSYADPYRAHVRAAGVERTEAFFPNVWGNVADDASAITDAVFPNIWGNVESGSEAAAGSATTPTPR